MAGSGIVAGDVGLEAHVPAPSRLGYVESLRGLACILLVSYHVVGGAPDEGLMLSLQHPLAILNYVFLPIRMPLFAFISGFVFSAAIQSWSEAADTLMAKARRLLLPLLSVGTLHFFFRSALHGEDWRNFWHIYILPFGHFWYLQATILIMAAMVFAALLFRDRPILAAAVCLGVGAGLYVLDVRLEHNWFSITKAFYLAPFFFFGQLVRVTGASKESERARRLRRYAAIAFGVLAVTLYAAREAGIFPAAFQSRQAPAMLLLSLSVCTFLFSLKWENSLLTLIGKHSYAIFLFHVFFTAGMREGAMRFLHIDSEYVIYVLGMIAGVVGPIAIGLLLLRNHAASVFFLGVRARARPARAAYSPIA